MIPELEGFDGPCDLASRGLPIPTAPGVYVVASGDCVSHVGTSGNVRRRVRSLAVLGTHRGSAEVICAAYCTGVGPRVWWQPAADAVAARVVERGLKARLGEPPAPRESHTGAWMASRFGQRSSQPPVSTRGRRASSKPSLQLAKSCICSSSRDSIPCGIESGSRRDRGRSERQALFRDSSSIRAASTVGTRTAIQAPVPFGPRYVHDPFFPATVRQGWRQNTDPFVFGERFYYTLCMQHTKLGPTQLRNLARGSVILFGSRVGGGSFGLDTVLVVDEHLDHSGCASAEVRTHVSAVYASVTLDPAYAGEPPDRVFRLDSGATEAQPTEGMFSFVPAAAARDRPNGFARPTLDLPEAITSTSPRGYRLNPQPSLEATRRLWERVVEQVRDQGLELATQIEVPATDSLLEERPPPQVRGC